MKQAPFKAYQTQEDKVRQNEMATTLAFLWDFTPVDQGDFAVIDYLCYRGGKLVALLEIKSRFTLKDEYSTYLCTTKDIDTGYDMSQKHGVPFVITVKWNDFWGYLKIKHTDYFQRVSGQKSRNDPNDYLAMCYLIPIREFKEVIL